MISFWKYWLENAELLKCPKSHRVRKLFGSQHFKASETLLKSARQYLCYIFWSFWKKNHLRWQVYSLSKSECLTQPIQVELSQNQNEFSAFFPHFRNLHKFLNTLKKKVEPHMSFLSEIIDWKKGSYLNAQKATVSEHLWTHKRLNRMKHCLNLHGSIFVIIFDNFWKYLKSWDSLLGIDTRWQVYSLSKSEFFTRLIEMQLSQNQIKFSRFFSAFLESR